MKIQKKILVRRRLIKIHRNIMKNYKENDKNK